MIDHDLREAYCKNCEADIDYYVGVYGRGLCDKCLAGYEEEKENENDIRL